MFHSDQMLAVAPESAGLEQHHIVGWLMWLMVPVILVGSTVMSVASMG